jgi:hypothetical protein
MMCTLTTTNVLSISGHQSLAQQSLRQHAQEPEDEQAEQNRLRLRQKDKKQIPACE